MSLVVDASIACKWFVEEVGSDDAELLLSSGEVLLAPDLIVPEVCNAMAKKLRAGELTSDQANRAIEALPGFIDNLCPSIRLGVRSLAIAEVLGHPVYDCFYLALAEFNDTNLITADARLRQRLVGTDWAERVIDSIQVSGG